MSVQANRLTMQDKPVGLREEIDSESSVRVNVTPRIGTVANLLDRGLRVKKNDTEGYSMSFIVPDIRCATCALTIERSLGKLEGIQDVNTNLVDKRVQIQFTREDLANDIIGLVHALGYAVKPEESGELESVLKDERNSLLTRLGVAGIGMMQVMMFAIATYVAGPEGMDEAYAALFRWASLALATPVALYSASVFHQGAYRDLTHGSLGMDVPVSLAILAAYFLSLTNTLTSQPEVYFDSVCMFTFFLLVGRYIESGSRISFQQSRELAEHLVPELSRTNVEPETFSETEQLAVGTKVYVFPGEPIPIDGVVISGRSSADESSFTGEVNAIPKREGDRVLAGAINLDGSIVVESLVQNRDFVINKISTLYRESTRYKPPFSILADKIARHFVAVILLLSLVSGAYWYLAGASNWFVVALTVLVVSCPCALSLATPIAYTIATTSLRKQGVVVSHGGFLERLATITAVAFDKTGTLTAGKLELIGTELLADLTLEQVRNIAASLEKSSCHPLARAFGVGNCEVTSAEIFPGEGVRGKIEGVEYRLGSHSFASGGKCQNPDPDGTWVLLASDKPLAWFRFEDSPRPEAGRVIKGVSELSCKTSLLTGDQSSSGLMLSRELDLDEVHVGLSPEDKVKVVSAMQASGDRVLMVGDGINDTAAMGIADVSIAVSPVDVFVQTAADATLLTTNLTALIMAIRYSKKVKAIIAQNISWALGYNMCVIPLAVFGVLEPWMAALGMSLSSVVVVLNSNRLIRVQSWK